MISSFPAHNCHHWGWLVSTAVLFLGRRLFEILKRKISTRTTGSCVFSDTTEKPLETIRNQSGTKQQVVDVFQILSELISTLYRLPIKKISLVIFFVLSMLQHSICAHFRWESPTLDVIIQLLQFGVWHPNHTTSQPLSPWQLLISYVYQISQWYQPTVRLVLYPRISAHAQGILTFKSNRSREKCISQEDDFIYRQLVLRCGLNHGGWFFCSTPAVLQTRCTHFQGGTWNTKERKTEIISHTYIE